MIPRVYIHHDTYITVAPHLNLVNVQHRQEHYPRSNLGYYAFYQYFIERDGKTVQCRPERDPTVEFKKPHKNSISICLAGNFDKQDFPVVQLEALTTLLHQLHQRHGITPLHVLEHRDYQATSCPGSKFEKGIFAKYFAKSEYTGVQLAFWEAILEIAAVIRKKHV